MHAGIWQASNISVTKTVVCLTHSLSDAVSYGRSITGPGSPNVAENSRSFTRLPNNVMSRLSESMSPEPDVRALIAGTAPPRGGARAI